MLAAAMSEAVGIGQGGMFVDDVGFEQPGDRPTVGEGGDTMEMGDNDEVFNLSNIE